MSKRTLIPTRPAFSLIELLVVIAIIATLAAILFPVFARAREQGRKAACLSNLKQIGLAFAAYTQDYDEGYPNTGDPYLWVGRRFRWPLLPYLAVGQKQKEGGSFDSEYGPSSILLCPSDTLSGSDYNATSYAYSAAFFHSPEQVAQMRVTNIYPHLADPGPGALCITQTEADIARPSEKALVAEWFTSHQWDGKQPVGYHGTLQGGKTPGPDRWVGSRAYLFADNHVKFLAARRITPTADDCPDILLTMGGVQGSDLP